MKGPEPFLAALEVELVGVVDRTSPALMDAAHRVAVNGHFFWAASDVGVEQFRAAPYLYTGPLLDPHMHEWFEPTAESPRKETATGILLFQSVETMHGFGEGGGSYAGHGHPPKP